MDLHFVTILNALKGPPGNILLALISHSRPLGTNELVTLTGWCESSVRAGLQKLQLLGLVERLGRYQGWSLVAQFRLSVNPPLFSEPDPDLSRLTDQGKELENPGSRGHREPEHHQVRFGNPVPHGSLESQEPEHHQVRFGNPTPQGSLVDEPSHTSQALTGNRVIYGANRTPGTARTVERQSSRKSQGSRPPQARASPARRCPSRKKYRSNRRNYASQSTEESLEEVLILKTLELSTSSDSHADSARAPQNGSPGPPDPPLSAANVGQILDATGPLFGERVMGSPAGYSDPLRLLAAIAEAYQNRRALRKPARVVFQNLRSGRHISPEFLADPLSFLPASFLQQAGLPRPRSPARSASSRYLDGLPDDGVDEEDESTDLETPPAPVPSVTLPVGGSTARTAEECWSQAKSVLQTQLETGLFLKYLAGSALVNYDSPSNSFTVAVEDAYARDWLKERLTCLVERLLNGICARPASVLFVTSKAAGWG